MSQILGEKQGLVFEIVSARICDENNEKKHVIYTLQVRFISGNDDLSPAVIERRYTHFLNLYNSLKKEQPQLMLNVTFPPKKLLGNFDNELISTRSTDFEAFLKLISMESKLRETKSLIDFLQSVELDKAKTLMEKQDYVQALPILENSFKLLNKVFTDRSPVVILALSRLLACCMFVPRQSGVEKWADLLLHRFEGISDSDLLELYIPLLQTCMKVWNDNAEYKGLVIERLEGLKRRGLKINETTSFLNEVSKVEEKIFGNHTHNI